MLLVGSRALKEHGSEFLSTAKRSWDWDFICTYDEYKNFKKTLKVKKIIPFAHGKIIALQTRENIYEFEIAWEDSTAESLLKMLPNLELAEYRDNIYIAKPNLVYSLKNSHRYLRNSPHFLKTMIDLRHLRDNCSCVVPDSLKEWYKFREKETYWYKHPSLNMNKSEFFKDDGVKYYYDHDDIHKSMAHFEKPAYEYYKESGQEVKCNKELFFSLPEEYRLHGVLEEAYVLALERSQIPAKGTCSPRKSFEMALMRLCTSITSGWFREYAWENYFKILDLYNNDYINKFWQAVTEGKVKSL